MAAHEYLGNEKGLAPRLCYTTDGKRYIHSEGFYFYMMEYIEGGQLAEMPKDEYDLGQLARKLHSLRDYGIPSALSSDKRKFYGWFAEKPFKAEFDAVLDRLPDFSRLDQCLIHSDLEPHNAMRRTTGEVVLIDLGQFSCISPICSAMDRTRWTRSGGY